MGGVVNRLANTWLAAAGLALAAVTRPCPAFAQAAGAGQAPDTAPAADSAPVPISGVPEYLAAHPRALNLTPKQVDRVHKVRIWLRGEDSTLRVQWRQITGGRAVRSMPPAERRRLAPQLQPVLQQLRANNAAALDSVDAILTPAQQQKLQADLAEYRERARTRRAAPGQ
jgi:Spy/CpxP family protein refolding chaperone